MERKWCTGFVIGKFYYMGNSMNYWTNHKLYKLLYLESYYISMVWMGMNHEETMGDIISTLNFTSSTAPSRRIRTIHEILHVGLHVNKSQFYEKLSFILQFFPCQQPLLFVLKVIKPHICILNLKKSWINKRKFVWMDKM